MSTGQHDASERAVRWVKDHQRQLTIGAVAVIILTGGVWFTRETQVRREAFASQELFSARLAMEAGNLQLAAADLGRIISTYRTTAAGQEAVILLANVHLQEGQSELAIAELQEFLNGRMDPQFESPAAALLGSALEDLGRFQEAADAFGRAAGTSDYVLISGQLALDEARNAILAGDTARAAGVYERLIAEDEDVEFATTIEAQFRLGELRRGQDNP